ncbi:alpha-ketoglutarate-dependent taurine dioxygenase [Ephemerocybe angulata]|uniref:Alpha-ketoglutarate-dependent taurine dioxygenase n=1 Tax=Ephemerocybe angulata TaxID=980116 RepID=A0A8H6IJG7_9AGAR|nr:alpha-ketoglutarate-dependent taurine dioxygenase [Tulosesus angulatus]
MAPSVADLEQKVQTGVTPNIADLKAAVQAVVSAGIPGPNLSAEILPPLSYPHLAPIEGENKISPPLQPFEHVDAASRADPKLPRLLNDKTKTHHLSPYLGTEISGVQISQLSKQGLDELSLYTAQRKVLIFRDQDFADLPPERQIEIVGHYGPLHEHPTAPQLEGFDNFIASLRQKGKKAYRAEYNVEDNLSYTLWHSDVSYERQPPATTFFWLLDQPEVGGDTLFLSQVEAYNRLSPEFRKRLETLRAIHSGVEQAEGSRKAGGVVRREGITTEHPVVRVHPVTGEKALFVNKGFTRSIVGFKKEESDALLNFLYDHIAKGADFQVRATYQKGTVVIWDNRIVAHSAVPDYGKEQRRHFLRLTPQGEVPIPASA